MTTQTKTSYATPITYKNNVDEEVVAFYLVTINNFEKSYLNNTSRYHYFLIVMIVPSGIFFFVAAIIMAIIMRRNFNKIQKNSKNMTDYCGFIRLNDFDL